MVASQLYDTTILFENISCYVYWALCLNVLRKETKIIKRRYMELVIKYLS